MAYLDSIRLAPARKGIDDVQLVSSVEIINSTLTVGEERLVIQLDIHLEQNGLKIRINFIVSPFPTKSR